MIVDAGMKLTQEERIRAVEEIRDRLESLGLPTSTLGDLNAWIEELKQLLASENFRQEDINI